jgi:hypothetical protein
MESELFQYNFIKFFFSLVIVDLPQMFLFVDLPRDGTEIDDATGCGPEGSPVHYRYTVDAHGIRHRGGESPAECYVAVDYKHSGTRRHTC